MSLNGITFGGLNSGLDTEGIISRFIQVESQPLLRMQRQQAQIEQRKNAYSQLRSQLSTLAQAANGLNNASAFNPVSGASTDATVATITGTPQSGAGTYDLRVSRLAQSHKIASAAQGSSSTAMGLSGEVVLNGKAVRVEATDSLAAFASKINAANTGITASILNSGSGTSFLTLTASNSGAANAIRMADGTGAVLQSLGIVAGAAAVREPLTNGAAGISLSSGDTAVGGLLGLSAASGTVQINGVDVSLDLATDSLQAIADKINGASTGASATVRTVSENGATRARLEISGATTPTFTDAGNVLQSLGILQRSAGTTVTAAQDAQFTLDGFSLTSATNVVSNAIPGATITLLKANETQPPSTTLSLTRDIAGIKRQINNFAEAFNNLNRFIRDNSRFDSETFQSGALFGDTMTQQVEAGISNLLFTDVPGLAGSTRNLAAIGFGLDPDGRVTVDDAALTRALQNDPEAVSRLFQSVGQGSTGTLQFVSATSKSKASSPAPYAVEITQVATQGRTTGSVAQTSASTVSERIRFSGPAFGSATVDVMLDIGSTLEAAVTKINNDPRVRDQVVASVDGGRLRLDSRRFGTNGNFSAVSNLTAASNNSGLGVGPAEQTVVAGLNVAGTINGEAATGNGQFLTGNAGNATTAGLQLQYTGSMVGSVGTMAFSRGVGPTVGDVIGGYTDSVNGLLATSDRALQDQIDNLNRNAESITSRLERRRTELRERFARMEEALARIQSQGSRLAALNQQQAR
jgi:flagellar hook-associated protein 2